MKTNSDTSHYLASSASRGKFVLSRRRNERGQVAIFVALIFQVVFVFFALLINVGLLVHHKINLQHSTDLAAYYGAMKQAEQMNAIAHINFQMRQAWKLLTWRYRIFGTFGFVENRDSPINGVAYPNTIQQFPFQQGSDGSPSRPFVFNGARGRVPTNINAPYVNGTDPMTCAAYGEPRLRVDGQFIGIQDIPFFCAGHDGISAWNPTENLCQLNCPMFLDARVIQAIPLVNNASTLMNSSLPGALNSSLNAANTVITNACTALGPVGVRLLTKFLLAYTAESTFRSETIKMLAQNLSQDVGQTVDLDGKRIIDGSERTFKNNLTGANFTGLDQSASFKAYNGLNSLKCRFVNGNSPNSYEFLRKVEFKLINYFVHSCEIDQSNAKRYAPASLYDTNGVNTVFTRPTGNPSVGPLGPDEVNFLLSLLDNRSLHNIGYEKNPNCVEYFAVKTFSEPNIPFLPLKKIRLEASAVAKPFGGSMGPAFGKRWDIGETNSGYNDADPNSKTDATMPIRGAPDNTVQDLKQSVYRQPNFALYVGDHLGLRNLDYIATYHSMLAKRDIQSYSGKTYTSARNLFNAIKPPPPNSWPAFNNWLNIGSITADARSYDSLATLEDSKAGTRAIEITAIAPNQFDVSYYSIDPDFYNNYYVKIFNNFTAIKQAAGNSVNLTANQIRADFGAVNMDGSPSVNPPLTEKSFSVKDQIYLKNVVLKDSPMVGPNTRMFGLPGASSSSKYTEFLNYLVTYQTSFLTGWTFLRFNDYATFPDEPVDKTSNTMSFGQCDDPWNKTTSSPDPLAASNYFSPMNENADNPPVPGNCVTGGRTGYSVKLVSPAVVLDPNLMENPMPLNFFDF